jgi:molybdopterin-guanine dinucleotide biosynthesis protein A
VAFRGEFWEPLLACYDVSLLPRVAERLHEGQTAMWKLLEASRGCALPLPSDWQNVQANTPQVLAAAAGKLRMA